MGRVSLERTTGSVYLSFTLVVLLGDASARTAGSTAVFSGLLSFMCLGQFIPTAVSFAGPSSPAWW